jgi:L-amino acid N-acyltransferase YncA
VPARLVWTRAPLRSLSAVLGGHGVVGCGRGEPVMTVIVREARPEDAESIVRIFNPIIESGLYTVFDRPFTVEQERRYIEAFPSRGILHVAVSPPDGEIVGFQSMEPFATFTHAFDHVGVPGTYVDLAQQRRGIARSLFGAMFEAARRKHYEKLFTYIRHDNPGALSTYCGQGFRVVGTAEKHAKVQGRYIDEIVVEKLL